MSTPAPLPHLDLQAYAYTVGHWVDGSHLDEYDLTAAYQRDSVWALDKRRNLIKSLIMGLPVGSITVADLNRDHAPGYRIVDGKQRIETVRAFVFNEFAVPGHWFNASELVDAGSLRHHDVCFEDLAKSAQRRFKTRQLPAIEFRSYVEVTEKPDGHGTGSDRYNFRRRSEVEMLQAEAELYLLVNFGGVPQTDDDRARAQEVAGS